MSIRQRVSFVPLGAAALHEPSRLSPKLTGADPAGSLSRTLLLLACCRSRALKEYRHQG